MQTFIHLGHGWFLAIFAFCGVMVLANVAHYVVFRVLRRKEEKRIGTGWSIYQYLSKPSRAIFFLTCLLIVLPLFPNLSEYLHSFLRQAFVMGIIISLGWFAIGCIYAVQAILLRRYDLTAENNIRARRIHTQFMLFRRILIALVVVITAGTLLWTFNDRRIWNWGSGLLASAGVASLILATAARSTASNFLAGLQIAFTEPIRIDDVVVVQGEWGRVEEITASYVVIRIWDLRRLIVPLSFFLENSFQNWTRSSTDILGTAFLYVDYSIPVEELRRELVRIAESTPLWDGQVCKLQVTNLSERTMELRCLVSSRNSSLNFELRCLVREQMTAYVQQHYPNAFPTLRFAATDGAAPEQERTAASSGAQEAEISSRR
ncbi:MAG TPA: mechanosensitive ion channel domain-containing protein [Edaphobacter sp.]